MRPKAGIAKQAKGQLFGWFRVFQLPNDENRDGSRNVTLLTVQPSDVARSPRYVYSIQAP